MGILNGIFGSPLPTDPLERAMLAHAGGQGSAEWLTRGARRTRRGAAGGRLARGHRAPRRPLTVSTLIGYSVVCAFTVLERAQEMRGLPDVAHRAAADYAC
jgi:hypothetical protein